MLREGKDGLIVFELFLVEVLKKDPNYNPRQSREHQLKKLIDRFTYILKRQRELKEEAEGLEIEAERKLRKRNEDNELVFNKIIKLNRAIHNLTSTNEELSSELKNIENSIKTHIHNSNSKVTSSKSEPD